MSPRVPPSVRGSTPTILATAHMITFYATPAGQSMIDKQPAIQQKMMLTMMGKMSGLGPRRQQMTKDFQAGISARSRRPLRRRRQNDVYRPDRSALWIERADDFGVQGGVGGDR